MKNNAKMKNEKKSKIVLPKGKFNSDWFKCGDCGYTVRMLVLGDTATCSECGGTMYRQ